MLSPFRAKRRREGAIGGHRWRRWLAAMTLPYPWRFRLAMQFGKIGQSFRFLTPATLHPMLDLVPDKLPSSQTLPVFTAAERTTERKISGTVDREVPNSKGKADLSAIAVEETVANTSGSGERMGAVPVRAKVALLVNCAQQVLDPSINAAAIRVLAKNGCEVHVPKRQGCCGALSWHIGDDQQAVRFAMSNLKAFPNDVDYIVTTAAGCGSGLHDYPLMLAGTSYEEQARGFASKTVDISVLLDKLGIVSVPPLKRPLKVAYHDACHLGHAQRVRSQPRRLLRSIPGLELIEVADSEICCGSAGTYNIDQPEISAQLGREKAAKLIATGADIVALGNIGCEVQIVRYLKEAKSTMRVMHTIELLDMAYRELSL
ncbi:MAG: (Fe-S)-binding protein [Pirellulaceae bacterium]|nr:(Fe-S)-binding protein [Pirellulaceae bacterium]